MAFPAASYPGLLTMVFLVQGSLGFLAWPVLSEVKPFGCADPCQGNFLLLLVPSLALYAWPLYMALEQRRAKTGDGGGGSAAGESTTSNDGHRL